jgi:branched-subunit amino acid transport protein
MTETLLVAICGAATYLWRGLGVVVSGRVRADGAVFTWVGCVAWAMIAGLTMRILLMPAGVLAETALLERAIGCAVALLCYFVLSRRNLFLGVGSAFATMIVLSLLQRA